MHIPLTRPEAEALRWSLYRYGEGDSATEATCARLGDLLDADPTSQDFLFALDEAEWVDVRDAVAYVLGNDMNPTARWMLEDIQDRVDRLDPDGPQLHI